MLIKGFLSRPHFNPSRLHLYAGLMAGILYALAFYGFAVCMREMMRINTFRADYDSLVVLSGKELFFYNWFFAIIACLTGAGVTMELWMKPSMTLPRRIKYTVYNDFTGLQWFFNYVFFKLAGMFGIFCSTIVIFYDLDFARDYWALFPLIVFVLFLQQWTRFRLYFRREGMKYMLIAALSMMVLSVAIAMLPLVPSERINEIYRRKTVAYHMTLNLPNAAYQTKLRRLVRTEPVFIGYSKTNSGRIIMLGADHATEISVSNLVRGLDEYDRIFVEVNADRYLRMKILTPFFDTLRTHDYRRLFLVTKRHHLGLPILLPPKCVETASTPEGITIECANELSLKPQLAFELTRSRLSVDGKNTTIAAAAKQVEAFVREGKKGKIILLYDDESTYGSLVEAIGICVDVVTQLRDEESRKQFSLPYFDRDTFEGTDKQYRYLADRFPINLLLLSTREAEAVKRKHD